MRIIKLLAYSPFLAIIIYFFLPLIILQQKLNSKKSLFLITLLIGFVLGRSMIRNYKSKLSINQKWSNILIKSKNISYLNLFTVLSILLWVISMGGISNIFDSNLREYYYQSLDQWDGFKWQFIVNKYLGVFFFLYPIYYGIHWGKLKSKNKKFVILIMLLLSLTKFLVGSRLFIIYFLIFLIVRMIFVDISKKKILLFILIFCSFIYYGFSQRYDGQLTTDIIISTFNANTNLDYIMNNNIISKTKFESFFYDITIIPASVFNYELPNLTTLKYGEFVGSSEPMPVIANIYYSLGYFGFIYFFIVGIFSKIGQNLVVKGKISGILLLFSIFYMFMIYINHSSFRASSRFMILIITVIFTQWILKFLTKKNSTIY